MIYQCHKIIRKINGVDEIKYLCFSMKLSNGHYQLIILSHTHVEECPQERGSAKSSAEEDMY